LIYSVFSDAQMPEIGDERKAKVNPLSNNFEKFEKKEFQDLWGRINQKAAYTVHFETDELVQKCVKAIDKELNISPLQYIRPPLKIELSSRKSRVRLREA